MTSIFLTSVLWLVSSSGGGAAPDALALAGAVYPTSTRQGVLLPMVW